MPSRPLFLSKVVRDLHWALDSPHLLTGDAGVPICTDEWCTQIVERAMPWLRSLDAAPQQLEEWLRTQRNVRRLGFYYAALLEFWVRFCPGFGTGAPNASVLKEQQIHAGVDGQVAGALKLVFERRPHESSCACGAEIVHWESHVKYFAWVPHPHGERQSPDDEVASSMAHYVGPFLGENLLHRVVELQRKVALTDGPAVQAFLQDRFRQIHLDNQLRDGECADSESALATTAAVARTIVTQSIVRGWLFYPLVGGRASPAVAGLSTAHARGWWTCSLDEVLREMPGSLWAVPGSGAGIREDAFGSVGGKLHWLSPAVAHGADAPDGRMCIRGIASLGVADCPLLGESELREALGQHCEEGGAALLLLQLCPLEDAGAPWQGCEAVGHAQGEVWVEVSRGFLMPTNWDPTPLMVASPLGLRGGMRQKQRSGQEMAEEDYREAGGPASIHPGILAVRTGATTGFGPSKAAAGASDADALADRVRLTELAEEAVQDAECDDAERALAVAVITEVQSTWKKLGFDLHMQVREVCLSFLAACHQAPGVSKGAVAGDEGAPWTGLEAAVGALVSLPTTAGPTKGKKSGAKPGGAAPNSRFALAKLTLSQTIAIGEKQGLGLASGAAELLHGLLAHLNQQRLLSSLLAASLANSGAIQPGSAAAAACTAMLHDAITGQVHLPASFVVETIQLFSARPAPSVVAGSHWPPRIATNALASYIHGLLAEVDDGQSLRHACALLRLLHLPASIVDCEPILRRLADANLWQLAEQLAYSAYRGPEKEHDAQQQADEATEHKGHQQEGDHYVKLQKAAKAATVAAVNLQTADTSAHTPHAALGEVESVQRVAIALGGYIKPAGGVPTHAKKSKAAGAGRPANVAKGDGGRLLQALLALAQQRSNLRLVAKLHPVVRELLGPDGANAAGVEVRADRESMLARLVAHDQLDVALAFAGEDRGLQSHLIKLLAIADHSDDATHLASILGLPLPNIMGGVAAADSVAGAMLVDRAAHESCTSQRAVPSAPPSLRPYELPPGAIVECFEGSAQAADADAAVGRMLQTLRPSASGSPGGTIVGVDAEWVAGRKISLMQLATRGHCLLLRLHTLVSQSGELPPSLVALLGDPSVLKLGVGVGNDLRLLHEQYGVASRSLVELQPLASREGFHCAGLQRLSGEVLGMHLDKRAEIRCGDWEASSLSGEQRMYAAMDAHVAIDIFERLHVVSASSLGGARSMREWCAGIVEHEVRREKTRRERQPHAQPRAEAEPTAAGVCTTAIARIPSGGDGPLLTLEPTRGEPLTSDDLGRSLVALGISSRTTLVPSTTADHSASLHVKSLAVFAKGSPLIAVLPTSRKLDIFKLARHLHLVLTSRRALGKQVRLATPDECIQVFGYRPGTVPPVGHRAQVPLVVDEVCAMSDVALLAGGGDFDTQLLISAADLTALHESSVADLCMEEGGHESMQRPHAAEGGDSANGASGARPEGSPGAGEESKAADVGEAPVPQAISSTPSRSALLGGGSHWRPQPSAAEPKFLVDAMMGRLLRWLRVLGVDSLPRDEGESVAQVLARASSSKRILLTRDRKVAERRECSVAAVFVVSSDESREQLREIVGHFGLRLSASEFMMRCSVCNGRGYNKLTKDEVSQRGDCPPKVLAAIDEFYSCRSCDKLYWEGPKSNNAFDYFSEVFDVFGASKGDSYLARSQRFPQAQLSHPGAESSEI